MTFDDQLREYFGSADLAAITPPALQAGIERILVDFGMEKDRGRRFALWLLLHTLGSAPDLEVAFATEAERNVARNFMEIAEREGDADDAGLGHEPLA